MDEAEHLEAVTSLLENVGAVPMTLQDLEDVDHPPSFYTEVQVMERESSGPRRVAAASQTRQWRVLTRAVGERYANAQEMRRLARIALHEVALVVGDETYYVEQSVPNDPIAPDDGWFSGTSEFTY